jgi:hypothetical protein
MSNSTAEIRSRLQALQARIRATADAAGRNPEEIRLIAVSKYMPPEVIRMAIGAGQRRFGENTVQESLRKLPLLREPDTEWHFIGHLQSNKARFIPGNFDWLHTLDSLKLARKLSGHAGAAGTRLNLLIQVNISGDPAKFGLPPERTLAFAEELLGADLQGLTLRGLMTIGRRGATDAECLTDFSRLRALRDTCARRLGAEHFRELSMGMSSDFEAAIRAGATMIRLGSAIFGARPPAAP